MDEPIDILSYTQMPTVRELMEQLDRKSNRNPVRWFTWRDFLLLLLPLAYISFLIFWVMTSRIPLEYYGAGETIKHGRAILASIFLAYMVQAAFQVIGGGVKTFKTIHLDYASNIDRLLDIEVAVANCLKHLSQNSLRHLRSRLEMEIASNEKSEIILVGIPVMLTFMKGFSFSAILYSQTDAAIGGVIMGIISLALLQLQLIRRLRRLTYVTTYAEMFYAK